MMYVPVLFSAANNGIVSEYEALQSSPIWLYITTHIMGTSKVVISSNTVHQQPYKKDVSDVGILSSNSLRNLRPIHYPPVTILFQFTGTGTTP